MAKNLTDCIADIQATVVAISGISDPGHGIIDSLDNGTFVVTEPADGNFTPSETFRKGVHVIRCSVFVKEDDYPRYRAALIGFVESIYDALRADVTLGGTCDTMTTIDYSYGPSKFGPYPVYGPVFTIGVKIQ